MRRPGLDADRHHVLRSSQASIQSSSSRCPVRSREPLEHDPLVEREHKRDEGIEREVEPELLADRSECLGEDRAPLGMHPCEPLLELGAVPGKRLQLEPELLVRTIFVEVRHRRSPFLEKRCVRRVQLSLPLDQPLGEALEHTHEQLLDRPEVVVDEAVVRSRRRGHLPRRDPRRTDIDEQPLRRVQERLLGVMSRACHYLRHPYKSFD